MTRSARLILLAAALVLPATLHACLGETVAWCDAHYGPTYQEAEFKSELLTGREYTKGSLKIRVYFRHGQAVEITYLPARDGATLQSERPKILQDNAGGSKWTEHKAAGEDARLWSRADGHADAMSFEYDRVLFLNSDWKKDLNKEERLILSHEEAQNAFD